MEEFVSAQVPAVGAPQASMSSHVVWRNGMAFDASVDGYVAPLDAGPEAGGQGYGPRPKALVLTALCGCTAMDVVAILRKMRVPLAGLTVGASGTLSATQPKVFIDIALRYDFSGADLPLDKLERAVALSLDKYCGVAAMLRPTARITHTIHVDDRVPAAHAPHL